MKPSAFKQVGSFWGVLPFNLAVVVLLICGRIFRPDVMPLWGCILGSIVFLMIALLPVGTYLQARRWEREEAAQENALSVHR